jgi:hypothetical protein
MDQDLQGLRCVGCPGPQSRLTRSAGPQIGSENPADLLQPSTPSAPTSAENMETSTDNQFGAWDENHFDAAEHAWTPSTAEANTGFIDIGTGTEGALKFDVFNAGRPRSLYALPLDSAAAAASLFKVIPPEQNELTLFLSVPFKCALRAAHAARPSAHAQRRLQPFGAPVVLSQKTAGGLPVAEPTLNGTALLGGVATSEPTTLTVRAALLRAFTLAHGCARCRLRSTAAALA